MRNVEDDRVPYRRPSVKKYSYTFLSWIAWLLFQHVEFIQFCGHLTGRQINLQEWNLGTVILIWNFHSKAWMEFMNLLWSTVGWVITKIFCMSNFFTDAGLGLDSPLLGSMHQGRKQHLWILWSVPSLKLIQKKLEHEQNKLHKISSVWRLVFYF